MSSRDVLTREPVTEPRLVCVACRRAAPLVGVPSRCDRCDEPFEVEYAISRADRDGGTRRGSVFEQFATFYPFLAIDSRMSLGEGRTPLVRSVGTARELGLQNLYFKNETVNPTWTFKDRGTACAVQHAVATGFTRFGTLSSGNMGASVAAFGRRAGLDTFVLLKAGTPREKVEAIAVHQVHVLLVSGHYDDIYQRALDIGREHGVYFSLSDEPMRIEGYKTLAFELVDQLGGEAPDFVATPVGSGGLSRGILKGFEELARAAIIERVPRMIGVQSEGCSPIADAYLSGADRIQRCSSPLTLDHVLENPAPPSGNQLLRKFRASGGLMTKVGNDAIVAAARQLAREGLFAQPASATALAGIARLVGSGELPREARIVSVVTGTGLKYPAALQAYGLSVTETPIESLPDVVASLAATQDIHV
jgi:threonine synthase